MSSKVAKTSRLCLKKSYSQTTHDLYLATALYDGVEDGDLRQLTSLIMTKGASPDIVLPEHGIAPIHLVVGLDDSDFCLKALNLFLCNGGDPNVRSTDGLTPVHVAALWGRNTVLELLLANGGDPWVLDNDNKNAFNHAHEQENWETFKMLDNFKKKMISEKPDVCTGGIRYKLRLDRVKVFNKDICAEYEAEPIPSICKATQTMQFAVDNATSNFSHESHPINEGDQIKAHQNNGLFPVELMQSVSRRIEQLEMKSNSAFSVPCVGKNNSNKYVDEIFDMKFDMVPNDQELKALEMVNFHRKGITVYEYKPDTDDYYADNDGNDCTISSANSTTNDRGYFTGNGKSQSKGLEKKLQPTDNKQIVYGDPNKSNWMANITQRRWGRDRLRKGQKCVSNFGNLLSKELEKKLQSNDNKQIEYGDLNGNDCTGNITNSALLRKGRTSISYSKSDSKGIDSQLSGIQDLEKSKETTSVSLNSTPRPGSARTKSQVRETCSESSSSVLKNYASKTKNNLRKVMSDINKNSAFDRNIDAQKSEAESLENVNLDGNSSSGSVEILDEIGFNTRGKQCVIPKKVRDNILLDAKAWNSTSKGFTAEGSTMLSYINPVERTNFISVSKHTADNKSNVEIKLMEGESSKNYRKGSSKESIVICCDGDDKDKKKSNEFVTVSPALSEMRRKFINDSLLTEDDSGSSQDFECFESSKLSDGISELGDGKNSKTSVSDKYFSCSSVEVNGSTINLCEVSDEITSVANSKNNMFFIDPSEDVNSNEYLHGQDLRNKSKEENFKEYIENNMDSASVISDWNGKSKIVSSTPEKNEDVYIDAESVSSSSSVSTDAVKGSPNTYSNSYVSEHSPMYSEKSCDIFESRESLSSEGILRKNNDSEEGLPILIKAQNFGEGSASGTHSDSLIYDEPIKRGFTFQHVTELTEDEGEVSITEEYLYTDEDDGIELVEECHLPYSQTSKLLNGTNTVDRKAAGDEILQEKHMSTSEKSETVCKAGGITTEESESALSSVEMAYETDSLRKDLEEFGIKAGPINGGTKRVYLRKLKRIRRRPKLPSPLNPRLKYSVELEHLLLSEEKKDLVIQKWSHLETEMCAPFQSPDPNKRWREGLAKASFTYLLLDPRITQNLPSRAISLNVQEKFECFLQAIFYVGRGKRSRPYSHLYEALSIWNCQKYPSSKKVNRILDIWRSGQGVVCLHVFQNVIPVEAMTREASMIDAIGPRCLTNERLGDHYGVAAAWNIRRRQQLGSVLLYKALNILLAEGERQLRPPDIAR